MTDRIAVSRRSDGRSCWSRPSSSRSWRSQWPHFLSCPRRAGRQRGASIDWSMPDRYGADGNGDGLVDSFAPDGPLEIDPSGFQVNFVASGGTACSGPIRGPGRSRACRISAGDLNVVGGDLVVRPVVPLPGGGHVRSHDRDEEHQRRRGGARHARCAGAGLPHRLDRRFGRIRRGQPDIAGARRSGRTSSVIAPRWPIPHVRLGRRSGGPADVGHVCASRLLRRHGHGRSARAVP